VTEEEIRGHVDRLFDLRFYVRTWGPVWWDEWWRRLSEGAAKADLQRLIFRGRDTSFGATHRKAGFLRWRRVLKCVLRHPDLRSIAEEGWRSFQRVMIRSLRARAGKRAPELMAEEGARLRDGVQKVLVDVGGLNAERAERALEEGGEGVLLVQLYSLESLKREAAYRIQNLLHGLKNRWCVVLKPQVEDPAFEGRHFDVEIYANRIEEFWDVKLLRERLGERFQW
jgi:hypothetical protein